jgi:hypothetical protein
MSSAITENMQREPSYSEAEQQKIHAHLEELLACEHFVGSRRRQAFLRYVVEESLAGRGGNIKETNIAVDVFGRSRDFDSQDSSIVRVTGADVRKRLAQAYANGLGQQDVRIELTPGGYQPSFYFTNHILEKREPIAAPPTIGIAEPTPHSRGWKRWMLPVAIAAGCLLVAGTAFQVRGMFQRPTALERMWQPFLEKDRSVLVSIATPVLLRINPLTQNKWLPLDPAKSIPASELLVLRDSYVGTGGAMGAALFAEQLTRRRQKFDLKFGSDINFGEIKNSPSILLGVSGLTQRLSMKTRFQLELTPDGIQVRDTKQNGRSWERPRPTSSSPPRADGYSIITRLVHSDWGHPLLMIGSMDSRNTQAAVEFLTNDDSFRKFADQAPADWADRNFQIVLHNVIYGNSPGSLSVVASEVW